MQIGIGIGADLPRPNTLVEAGPTLITERGRVTNFVASGDPVAFAITVPAGTDFIVVKFGHESSRTITIVRIGATAAGASGAAFTEDTNSTSLEGVVHSEIWYRNWSTTGVQELWVDMSGGGELTYEVVYLKDVHQSNPIVASDGAITDAGSVCTLPEALDPGLETCWCEAVLGDGDGSTVTYTWTGGVTQRNNVDHGTGRMTTASAADVVLPVTPQAQRSSGAGSDMAMSVILLRPAA